MKPTTGRFFPSKGDPTKYFFIASCDAGSNINAGHAAS
jgi:hypothetical protein